MDIYVRFQGMYRQKSKHGDFQSAELKTWIWIAFFEKLGDTSLHKNSHKNHGEKKQGVPTQPAMWTESPDNSEFLRLCFRFSICSLSFLCVLCLCVASFFLGTRFEVLKHQRVDLDSLEVKSQEQNGKFRAKGQRLIHLVPDVQVFWETFAQLTTLTSCVPKSTPSAFTF